MTFDSIQFRPAQANDVADAIPLIYSSGPTAFDYVFTNQKGDVRDFLHEAFLDGAGEFGYRNHIVGTMDDRVVCIGAGYTGASGLSFTLTALRQILRFYGLPSAITVIINGLRTEQVIKTPAKDEYGIGHLGVHPDLRGQGIGTQLVNHLLSPQYTAGCRTAVLDVAVTNPRAESLYERMGFVVTELCQSTLSNQYGKVVDHRRMEKSL